MDLAVFSSPPTPSILRPALAPKTSHLLLHVPFRPFASIPGALRSRAQSRWPKPACSSSRAEGSAVEEVAGESVSYNGGYLDENKQPSGSGNGRAEMDILGEGDVAVLAPLTDTVPDAPSTESRSIWQQMKEIVVFAGPATGLWICGPLMSLIDTAVIGQSSSLELAALGPGTVFCDYLCYIFMFLSIATSNMVATSLARKDKKLAQHQISMLLFVAFTCGLGMLFFTKFAGTKVLSGFIGSENMHLAPAANSYVEIRSYAWPAVLVGMVAQSACLGMKDSWGPLKALAVASAINGFGDILLCSVFGYGIAGAAWATMLSQVVAAIMMMQNLKKAGFNAYSISIPSARDLVQIFELAAPVFVTMTSKVAFYALLTYFATAMGTITVAAHQVMINVYCMCTVWGEPLSQTAQSFMPELIHGLNRSLEKARMLLKSLVIIGALTGLTLGAVGTSVPWIFPSIFTSDGLVVKKMHQVLIPYFVALVVTPSTHSLEGTLLAGRDLKFLSFSMTGCFSVGGLLLLVCNRGFGLYGCWWALAGFQWARFSLALNRLTSPRGMLYSDEFYQERGHDVKTL